MQAAGRAVCGALSCRKTGSGLFSFRCTPRSATRTPPEKAHALPDLPGAPPEKAGTPPDLPGTPPEKAHARLK